MDKRSASLCRRKLPVWILISYCLIFSAKALFAAELPNNSSSLVVPATQNMTAPEATAATVPAEVVSLDLEKLLELVHNYHPDIQVAQAELAVAREVWERSKTERLPALTLLSRLGYLDGQAIGARGIVTGGRTSSSSGAYLNGQLVATLPIFREGTLIGRTSAAELVAESGKERAGFQRLQALEQVNQLVVNDYYQLLGLRKSKQVLELKLEATRLDLSAKQADFTAERISRQELLKAELEARRVGWELQIETKALKSTRRRLLRLAQLEGRDVVFDSDNTVPVILDLPEELVARAEAHNPLILAQEARIRQMQAEFDKVSAGRMPQVDMLLNYGGGTDFDDTNDSVHVALALSYDLLDSGRQSHDESLARQRVQLEVQKLHQLQMQVRDSVFASFDRIEELNSHQKILWEQVAGMREELRLAQEEFSHEMISRADLLLQKSKLEQTELEAQLSQYNLQREHWRLRLYGSL